MVGFLFRRDFCGSTRPSGVAGRVSCTGAGTTSRFLGIVGCAAGHRAIGGRSAVRRRGRPVTRLLGATGTVVCSCATATAAYASHIGDSSCRRCGTGAVSGDPLLLGCSRLAVQRTISSLNLINLTLGTCVNAHWREG